MLTFTVMQRRNNSDIVRVTLHGKSISITYSECVFLAISIQQVMRMRHIFICCLLGSKIFLINKRHDIWKKKVLNTKCVF